MGGNQPNYRLTEGALIKCVPTEIQLWNAVRSILSSEKRSTYKFAFLQSIVNISMLSKQTSFQLLDIFENVAAMYWRLLVFRQSRSSSTMPQRFHLSLSWHGSR